MASTSSSSSPPPSDALASSPPNWLDLPAEVTTSILHRLGTIEILDTAQKVCLTWRKICKDPAMWQSIEMLNLGEMRIDKRPDLDKVCRHAVDWSCGGLREINLEYFATDELLHYISDRAPQLRRLQFHSCDNSEEGLTEVSKKLPNLEELHIDSTPSPESLEIIGQSCPNLKSLTCNFNFSQIPNIGDGHALAIAQTMPELRHLSLFGKEMTNVGLQAILDHCPNLESLDLRPCFFVDLEGAFGRTCAQRIKRLKCLNDPPEDDKFDNDGDLRGDPGYDTADSDDYEGDYYYQDPW